MLNQVVTNLINRYGLPAIFIKIQQVGGTDYTTGKAVVTRTEYEIKKAIRLTVSNYKNLISQIAGNFKTSGQFDEITLRLLLRSKDLTVDIATDKDYIILDNKKYNIIRVDNLPQHDAMIFNLKVTNEKSTRSFVLKVTQKLKMRGLLANEL